MPPGCHGWHRPIRRIQRQFPGLLSGRIKHFDLLGPTRLLAVIDLTQVQQVPLHPTSPRAHLFSDAPITVIFAVLESVMTLEKRFGHINGSDFTPAQVQLGSG